MRLELNHNRIFFFHNIAFEQKSEFLFLLLFYSFSSIIRDRNIENWLGFCNFGMLCFLNLLNKLIKINLDSLLLIIFSAQRATEVFLHECLQRDPERDWKNFLSLMVFLIFELCLWWFLETVYEYIDKRLLLLLYDVFKLLQKTHRRNTQNERNYDSKLQSREKPPKYIFKFGKTFLTREISTKNRQYFALKFAIVTSERKEKECNFSCE